MRLDRPISRLVFMWAIWSASILFLASATQNIRGPAKQPWLNTGIAHPVPPLARWDSEMYYWIATRGYSYDSDPTHSPIGFYPLYPLLVRAAVAITHGPVFWTGICISLVCLLGALLLIRDLACHWDPQGNADETLYAILFFPTAFFFAAFYTESLFLLTTAAAIWGARRGYWPVAAIAGAAAALTRFNGMLIALPLALYALGEAGWRLRGLRLKHVGTLFSTAAGAVAFPAYLFLRWGDAFLYIKSKTAGAQSILPPTHLLGTATRNAIKMSSSPFFGGQVRFWLEIGSLFGFSVLTLLLFRRRMLPEACYCAATLLVLFGTGTLDGSARYVLVLFPCFFVVGRLFQHSDMLSFTYRYLGASSSTLLLAKFPLEWVA